MLRYVKLLLYEELILLQYKNKLCAEWFNRLGYYAEIWIWTNHLNETLKINYEFHPACLEPE